MRRTLLLALALLSPGLLHAASWTKSWGNLQNAWPVGVVALRDGSVVAAVRAQSPRLFRVAPDGTLLWSRALDRCCLTVIARATNDDIFLGGYNGLARMHPDGTILWAFHLQIVSDFVPQAAAGTRDGGVIVCGGTRLQSWIVKLSAAGVVEWQHGFDGGLMTIVQTADGGYLAGGNDFGPPQNPLHHTVGYQGGILYSDSPQGHPLGAIVVKLSARGDEMWHLGYAGPGEIAAVAERNDGDIFVAGSISGAMFFSRVSPRGFPVWQEVAPAIHSDEVYEALILPSGNLLAIAVTGSYVDTGEALMLIELTPDGEIVRQSVGENQIQRGHFGALTRDGAVCLLSVSKDAARLRRMESGIPSANDCWSAANATVSKNIRSPEWTLFDTALKSEPEPLHSSVEPLTEGPACRPVTMFAQMVLRTELTLTSGERYDPNAFLVKKPDGGIVAVSAVPQLRPAFVEFQKLPTANDQLRSRLKTWAMHAPAAADGLSATAVVPRSSTIADAGVVLDVGNPAEPPVHPLLPRTTELKNFDKVLLLGCPRPETTCRQNVYEGNVLMPWGPGQIIVRFLEITDITPFYGSPVLDEEGRAVGVVSGWHAEPGRTGALVEEIRILLPTAGSGAPAPRP